MRAGLIGLGMMGRHHARVLREVDGVELVAVADANGDPHGVAHDLPLFTSVEDLIGIGLDMAIVAVPTTLHQEVALALAEAGIHTLVEKPIAFDLLEGKRIAEAFAVRNLVGAVGHVERFNPALQALRMRLEAGELGEVYQISTRRHGPFPARIGDVGVVKDLATHDFDLTAWLAKSRYESLFAQTASRSDLPHEDLMAATGRLECGVVVNHSINWLSPMKERLTIVTGEMGTYVADTITMDLTFYKNGTEPTQWDTLAAFRGVTEGDVIRIALAKPEPLRTEHEAFRDAILGREDRTVTMADGLETLRVAEFALQSAELGSSVDIGSGSF